MKNPNREYYFGADGQKLFVQEWGDIGKPVVFLIHGFPGCGDQGRLLMSSSNKNGFRLISFDRPGYGRSEFQKKLTPTAFAEQVRNLSDYLKIDQFRLLSVSGGAPYSMAVASLLQERVLKISSVAGIAPLTIKNFGFMNRNQKKAWILRNFVPGPILTYGMNRMWKSGLEKVDQFLFSDLSDFSAPDQIVFKHPVMGPALIKTVTKALRPGASGILHDMKVYSRPWGFSLKNIVCPVTLWHGDDDDVVNVRFTKDMNHRLPHAKVNLIPGEGHYSLPMNFHEQIIEDLLS